MQQNDEEKIEYYKKMHPEFGGFLKVNHISKIFNVTPQGVYYHISTGRINVYKYGDLNIVDPHQYAKMRKWDRSFTLKNGKFLYDDDKYSISHLSKLMNIKPHYFYYLIKSGKLRAQKIEGCLVIEKEDILNCPHIQSMMKKFLGKVINECIDSGSERCRSDDEKKVSVI